MLIFLKIKALFATICFFTFNSILKEAISFKYHNITVDFDNINHHFYFINPNVYDIFG